MRTSPVWGTRAALFGLECAAVHALDHVNDASAHHVRVATPRGTVEHRLVLRLFRTAGEERCEFEAIPQQLSHKEILVGSASWHRAALELAACGAIAARCAAEQVTPEYVMDVVERAGRPSEADA